MSTILKALRRLEADERKKSETQDLTSETPVSSSPRRLFPGPLAWIFGAMAVLIGAGIGVGLRGWWVEDAPVEARSLAETRTVLPPVEEGPTSLAPRPPGRVMEPEGVDARRDDPKSIPHVVSRTPLQAGAARTPVRVASAEGSAVVAAQQAEAERRVRVVSNLPIAEPAPVPERPKTPVAPGPSRSVEALPLAAAAPAVAPSPKATPPVVEAPAAPPVARKPEPLAKPEPAVKLAALSPAPAVKTEKIPAAAARKIPSRPAPVPAKVTPPPVSAAAAATVPASLKVTVMSTTWHPKREKRSASLSHDGRPSDSAFAEGDVWMGWRVVEIKLSGVSFERQGVRVERKVGQSP
ncbi:MAG: hypothetical protein VX252_14490 [Myxococcota bacterium]|nr:hypothetical protein [Myxococcota bacterium]